VCLQEKWRGGWGGGGVGGDQTLELFDGIHMKQQRLFARFVSAAMALFAGHAPTVHAARCSAHAHLL
jgi:hypothetical protein